ncbi:MAG: hypothetical protein NC252_12280, partial [Roseburia sp.]|nr:hypothetical protein [Roseburia sp.]MCM1440104.1 hypothetical protein [Roseburia sp.]
MQNKRFIPEQTIFAVEKSGRKFHFPLPTLLLTQPFPPESFLLVDFFVLFPPKNRPLTTRKLSKYGVKTDNCQ